MSNFMKPHLETKLITNQLSIPPQALNLVILIIYRTGYGGDFLGVGGTWNLNEEKSPDAEIVASGVFVGYFIYTSVQLITFCFGTTKLKRELSDTIMNVVGTFMWIAVGGTALHYWHGFQPEYDFQQITSERTVRHPPELPLCPIKL